MLSLLFDFEVFCLKSDTGGLGSLVSPFKQKAGAPSVLLGDLGIEDSGLTRAY